MTQMAPGWLSPGETPPLNLPLTTDDHWPWSRLTEGYPSLSPAFRTFSFPLIRCLILYITHEKNPSFDDVTWMIVEVVLAVSQSTLNEEYDPTYTLPSGHSFQRRREVDHGCPLQGQLDPISENSTLAKPVPQILFRI